MASRYQYYSRRRGFRPRGRRAALVRVGDVNMPMALGRAYTGRRLVSTRSKFIRKGFKRAKAAIRSAPSRPQSTRQFGQITQGTTGTTVQQRTLFTDPIPFPPQDGNVAGRLGSTIRVSGIKVCERFINTNSFPIVLHYALVQPRCIDGAFDFNEGFFRSTIRANIAEETARNENFVNAFPNAEYEFLYDCFPINPDKFWIITHQKKMLAPRDPLTSETAEQINMVPRRYMWNIDRYYPMKGKRMTFEDKDDILPQYPIYRIFWWQVAEPGDWGVAPETGEITRLKKSVVYFKNGLN